MKSLSLVLFAGLTQAAVGLVWVSLMAPGGVGARLALPLAALGLVISLAHLGTPSGAVRALANLRSSWLSREVLLTGLFTLGAGVYTWVGPGASGAVWAAGLVTGALGLAALIAQGMVYQLPTRPEWRHGANLAGALAAAVQVGALATALGGGVSGDELGALGTLALAASAGVLVAAAFWAAHVARLGHGDVLADTWFWVRLVAGVMLPGLSGLALAMGMAPDFLTTGGALAGAVTGELIGRSLFYRVGQAPPPATQF
ncbi:MAG: anaerobic dimethyl sulfoxide reductase subunit [Symbiobacteriaceae bacterium]|jgi:anaerobic dimethyl sulfoxide reductase subunit C (anchor subunit)|nr:anaerobic dimethyl sulfoxide reductase subunit [Symbiobacteriaceae bacterium]